MSVAAVPQQLQELTEAAQRQAANPLTSAWVAASAGSGKTKVLADRVLSLLLAGVSPQRILCLTFTKEAAAEMAQRVNGELGKWAIAEEQDLAEKLTALTGGPVDAERFTRARRLFAQVLDVPDGMKIMTIHAFCQSVLRRFPIEAEVVPHFAVMDERDSSELLEAVQLELMVRAQADDGNLAAAVADIASRIHETRFPDLMAELAAARGSIADLIDRHGKVESLVAAIFATLGLDDGETPETVVTAACEESSLNSAGLRRAAAALTQGSDRDQGRASVIAHWLSEADNRNDLFETYCGVFLTREGQIRKTLITKSPLTSDAQAGETLAAEAARVHAARARLSSANVAQATAVLIRIAAALIESYTRHKSARALLDYDDLIIRTRQLLEAEGRAAWVLFKLDGGIDHVLIDEAQDTNLTSGASWLPWRTNFSSATAVAMRHSKMPNCRRAVSLRWVMSNSRSTVFKAPNPKHSKGCGAILTKARSMLNSAGTMCVSTYRSVRPARCCKPLMPCSLMRRRATVLSMVMKS